VELNKHNYGALRRSNPNQPSNGQRNLRKSLLYGKTDEIPERVQEYLRTVNGFNP
jgi:hypothetical protein